MSVVAFSFLCPLLEKYGTFIARCNALIEKVSPFRRARTVWSEAWDPSTSVEVGAVLQTVDMSRVVQEIITQPGWESGNPIVIIVSHEHGSGNRWVRADTATLVLEYTEPHLGSYPGCWCPEELDSCDVWSATLTGTLHAAETSLFRFMLESAVTSEVEIEVDGKSVHTSGCEVVNGDCYERLFDTTLVSGDHEVVIRFVEHDGNAQLGLAWESVTLMRMRECFMDARATDYRGRVAVTADGHGCADWSSQSPHPHDANTPESAPNAGLDNNYCRNPNGRETAWCYTVDETQRWGLCDVGIASTTCEMCDENEWFVEIYDNVDFRGIVSTECGFGAADGSLNVGLPGALPDDSELISASFCPDSLQGECQYFSATFSKTITLNTGGVYRFFEHSRNDAILFVDGIKVHETSCGTPRCSEHNFEQTLDAGTHRVLYELQAYVGDAYAHLQWELVGNGECRFSRGDYNWIDATGGTQLPLNDDDGHHVVELPFTFPFYGGVKRSLQVSSNGYITFSGSHLGFGDSMPIPSTAAPNDMIAVYWTDLDPSSGGAVYSFVPEGSPFFVVEWHNIPYFIRDDADDSRRVTFEAVLYPSGAIKLQYHSVPPNPNEWGQPSIGIESGDGESGLQISFPPDSALNDPYFAGAEAAYYIPSPCDVRDCSPGLWRVEVYRNDDFSDRVSTSCQSFSAEPFLATTAKCEGVEEQSYDSYEACWCPAALHGYQLDADDSSGPTQSTHASVVQYSTGSVQPRVEIWKVDSVMGHTTYRLLLDASENVRNVYAIYGNSDFPLYVPPAFQSDIPFGRSVGTGRDGTNSQYWTNHPDAEYDSWLAVGLGQPPHAISMSGINFRDWDANRPLNVNTSGSVYWRDGNRAWLQRDENNRNYAVVAQLTLPSDRSFVAKVNAQGQSIVGDDWDQRNIIFHINPQGSSFDSGHVGSMEPSCEFFSAIFSSTIEVRDAGRYRFMEASDSSTLVYLDGSELSQDGCVLDSGVCVENIYSAFLQEGSHQITAKFVESTGGAYCHIWWQYVGSNCEYSAGAIEDDDWVDAHLYPGSALDLNADSSVEVPIRFRFPFYGGEKTVARVSANGYISFSGNQYSYGDTYAIPDIAPPNEIIAVYWTDLDPGGARGGTVHAYGSDTKFVAMWNDVPVYETNIRCTFQVQLAPSGAIVMLYRQMAEGHEHSYHSHSQPSIGIENIDGSRGLRIAYGANDVAKFTQLDTKVEIPAGCEVEECEEDAWLVEVYDDTGGHGTNHGRGIRRSVHCEQFREPTSDAVTPYINRHSQPNCTDENSRCWCPEAVAANTERLCAPFVITFTTQLAIRRAGTYRFVEDSSDQAVIFIDGQQLHKSGCIIDDDAQCTDSKTFEVELTFGVHHVIFTVEHFGSGGMFTGDQRTSFPELSWEFAGSGGCDWQVRAQEDWHSRAGYENAVCILNTTTATMASVQLPFTFPFYGGEFSSLKVYADGYISFSDSVFSVGRTNQLPTTLPPNAMVAVYWTNFEMRRHGSVWTYAREQQDFTIEWSEIAHADTGQRHTFQLWLYDADGSMMFVYHDIPPLSRYNEMTQPSVGIENFAGNDGIRIGYGLDELAANGIHSGVSITIDGPGGCHTSTCGPQHWVLTVYSSAHFSDPIRTECAFFNDDGFIETEDGFCPVDPDPDNPTVCPSFSAIISQDIRVSESGMYRFRDISDGLAILFINGQQVLRSFPGERLYAVDVGLRGGITYSLQYGYMRISNRTSAPPGIALSWEKRGGGCQWGATQYLWEDITDVGESHVVDDDGFFEVALPFDHGFPFFGGNKDVARVSANGYLTFSGGRE
eukprot:SAG31_NODE_133_length_23315_cov_4.858847_6_plen_1809_part_00